MTQHVIHMHKNVLAMVLAGGMGTRLYPLTAIRPKPAVRFGGKYRILDFVINNLVNSGFFKINILTQYKSYSLIRHVQDGWGFLPRYLGQYVDAVPAPLASEKNWYLGTADGIYQNKELIELANPEYVAVFAGDHIYKMDVGQMLDYHVKKKSEATVAVIPVPIEEASRFGVLAVDKDGRIIAFDEKPKNPKHMPGDPTKALVSMGNYIFNTQALIDNVIKDSYTSMEHDFGKNVIPAMIEKYKVYAYNFATNTHPEMEEKEQGYWKDVGTVDSYYQANMDLVAVDPVFNLYNHHWPIRTPTQVVAPAKFVWSEGDRQGKALDSMVCGGVIISGGSAKRTIISPNVKINSWANISDSIIFDDAEIGRYCVLNKVIVEEGVKIPEGEKIGVNLEEDKKRFYVSENGVVVVFSNLCFRMKT